MNKDLLREVKEILDFQRQTDYEDGRFEEWEGAINDLSDMLVRVIDILLMS